MRIEAGFPGSRISLQRIGLLLLLGPSLALLGCRDQAMLTEENPVASFSMAAVFPDASRNQATYVDSWRVQVLRSGEGLIEERSGSIGPEQATISVDVTVELNSACETLTIGVDLSAGGQVWFRSQEDHQICSGRSNEVGVAELQWVRPSATVSPSSLSFTIQERQSTSGTFTISYGGVDNLSWSATVVGDGVDWLSLEPSSGTTPGGQPAQVQVLADAENLLRGSYSASIVVTGQGFPSPIGQIPVNLTVTEGPSLGVSPSTLSFTVNEGSTPDAQVFTVTNQGAGSLAWSASDDAGWLSLAPTPGSLGAGESQLVTVSADVGELAPGDYAATITVSGVDADNSPQTIAVDLTKIPAPSIGLSTTNLSFTAVGGTPPATQELTVSNEGGGALNWSASDDAFWLSMEPASGSLQAGLSQAVTVTVNVGDLPPGEYSATITFSAPGADNSPRTVAVDLAKVPPPSIGLSTTSLSFTAEERTNPTPQQLTVSNAGGGALNWSATDDAAWLGLEPSTGILPAGLGQTVTVTVNTQNLSVGDYSATITFSAPGADNSPRTVEVSLDVTEERIPPTIAELAWEEIQVNDPTCGNQGTRFEFYFVYSDPEGDVLVSNGAFVGNPIGLAWEFIEGGTTGSASTTGSVDGTGFSGSASFQMCIAFQVPVNTSVNITVTLSDGGGRESNALTTNVPRPEGANAPPWKSPIQAGGGSLIPGDRRDSR